MSATLRLHVLSRPGLTPGPTGRRASTPTHHWLTAFDRYLEDLALELEVPADEPEDIVLVPLDDEHDDDPYGMAGFLAA